MTTQEGYEDMLCWVFGHNRLSLGPNSVLWARKCNQSLCRQGQVVNGRNFYFGWTIPLGKWSLTGIAAPPLYSLRLCGAPWTTDNNQSASSTLLSSRGTLKIKHGGHVHFVLNSGTWFVKRLCKSLSVIPRFSTMETVSHSDENNTVHSRACGGPPQRLWRCAVNGWKDYSVIVNDLQGFKLRNVLLASRCNFVKSACRERQMFYTETKWNKITESKPSNFDQQIQESINY